MAEVDPRGARIAQLQAMVAEGDARIAELWRRLKWYHRVRDGPLAREHFEILQWEGAAKSYPASSLANHTKCGRAT
jgi:hypothetical protein